MGASHNKLPRVLRGRRRSCGKGLSQEELAHRARVHQTYLAGVEGEKLNPSIGVLGCIVTALGESHAQRLQRNAVCWVWKAQDSFCPPSGNV